MTKSELRLLPAVFLRVCLARHASADGGRKVDFYADSDRFHPANWQEQMLWLECEFRR